MTAPIEDVSKLPGKKVTDQDEAPLGEIKSIYATEQGFPMWISLEIKMGLFAKRTALVPLARIKEENDDIRVQYSKKHVLDAPQPDEDDKISEECDRELRIYYGIGTADQEMWDDNSGYSTLVPEEPGAAERVEDPDELETPDADKRSEETNERVRDPGSSELREVSAEDVFQQGGAEEADES